jgi:aldose sugar dehydrogenase
MNAKHAVLIVTAALLGTAARAVAQDFPPGPDHDLVVKSCTSCHDAGTVTSQHMPAQAWAGTVKQMVSRGAPLSGGDIDEVVRYLAEHFGPTQTSQAQPGNTPVHSPLDVPGNAPLTWRKVEGQPIDTRWPEKQDDAPEFPGQTRAPYHASVPYTTTIIADKLVHPWALAFLPDGKFLVTERLGQLVIVGADGTISQPIAGVPAVASDGGQGGLLDVVLDRNFATSHRIFFSFDELSGPQQNVGRDGAQSAIAVGRATLDEAAGALRDVTVVFRTKPAISVNLYPTKQGSRIAIAPDGNLFVTIGDRDSTRLQPPPWNVAQSLATHLGKIVRITPDGKAAPGNPFTADPDAQPEIWATGVRSQEGLTFDSKGRLWEVEDGPRGGDELNIIEKGKNYGWPIVTHGIDYPGWVIGDGITHKTGMVPPRYYWDPTIAPSGLAFYYGNLFPEWKGSLLVGALRGMMVDRLTLSSDDKVISEEPLLNELQTRIRDVRVGPEGAVYVLTDASTLLKITPKSPSSAR